MDVSTIIGTLTGAKQLASSILEVRDRQKLAAVQIDLTEKIIQAQVQLSEVLAAVIEKDAVLHELIERCRHLEANQAEKARYQLAKLGSRGEFFAYRLRPEAELVERQDEVPHFLCQPCFDAGKKSVLFSNNGGFWQCAICRVGHQVEPTESMVLSTGFREDYRGY